MQEFPPKSPFLIQRATLKQIPKKHWDNTSSRYRILFPRVGEKSHVNVSHWVFSMNGMDYLCYFKNGKTGRGFSFHKEFSPQWNYVNDLIKEN